MIVWEGGEDWQWLAIHTILVHREESCSELPLEKESKSFSNYLTVLHTYTQTQTQTRTRRNELFRMCLDKKE